MPNISPLPLWLGDGRIADELKDRFVFLDPVTNEVVVLTPSDNAAGPAKQLRFELQNMALTVVSTTVTQRQDGLYAYEYNIRVAPGSRRPLRQWSLLLPGLDSKLSADVSSLWQTETAQTDMVDRLASKHVPLKYLHFKVKPGYEMAAGGAALEVRIISKYAPGYVTAFSRSKPAKELPPAGMAELAKDVVDQIAKVLEPEFDSRMELVIGPRFDRDTPMATVASSFDFAMQHFTVRGDMTDASEFAKSCTAAIRWYTESATESINVAPPALDCTTKAQTQREKEIAHAMRLSLVRDR
ncbi:MAG TPA: hypothetical protein VFQ79_10830 [Bryobacteraceae bacterium]|nr:hypothetical protein [Bryobacteraceae bacterium]